MGRLGCPAHGKPGSESSDFEAGFGADLQGSKEPVPWGADEGQLGPSVFEHNIEQVRSARLALTHVQCYESRC